MSGADFSDSLILVPERSCIPLAIFIRCINADNPDPGDASLLKIFGTGGAFVSCTNVSVTAVDFRALGVVTRCCRFLTALGGAVVGITGFFRSRRPTRGVAWAGSTLVWSLGTKAAGSSWAARAKDSESHLASESTCVP